MTFNKAYQDARERSLFNELKALCVSFGRSNVERIFDEVKEELDIEDSAPCVSCGLSAERNSDKVFLCESCGKDNQRQTDAENRSNGRV